MSFLRKFISFASKNLCDKGKVFVCAEDNIEIRELTKKIRFFI